MEIFISRDGKELGPYSPREIRDRIASGQLTRADLAWYEGLPDWVPLSELRLPPEEEATLVPVKMRAPALRQSHSPAVQTRPATKQCPFCAEEIKLDAIKCKHCGEVLDPKLRAIEESQRAAEAARAAKIVQSAPAPAPGNVNVKVNIDGRQKSSSFSSCGCLILFIIGLIIFLASIGQHPG